MQYVPQVIFPKFKRERGSHYFKFLIDFAENQAMNSEKNVEIWTSILDNCAKQRVQAGQNPDESLLVVAKNANVTADQTNIRMEKAMGFKDDIQAKKLEEELKQEQDESLLNPNPKPAENPVDKVTAADLSDIFSAPSRDPANSMAV